MTNEWLRANAQVLSVPPVFDASSIQLISIPHAMELTKDRGQSADDVLRDLHLAGLVVQEWEVWRIADPARSFYLEELQRDRPDVFARVARDFADHTSNGFRSTFEDALGSDGANLNLAVLRVAASPDEDTAFSELIDVVESLSYTRRFGNTEAAIRLLTSIPQTEKQTRQLTFLRGLAYWQRNERATASRYFEQTISGTSEDRIIAVAAHLLGVFREQQGDTPQAATLLRRSVQANRTIGDRRGLCVTLTTLGRVQRELVVRVRETGMDASVLHDLLAGYQAQPVEATERDLLDLSLVTLQEAVDVGYSMGDKVATGIALNQLAVSYQEQGLIEGALASANEALDVLPQGNSARFYSTMILGSIYKEEGRLDDAARVLEQGIEVAEEAGDLQDLAELLNVLASSERNSGNSVGAIRHARMSVELGERLNNRRHLSHALQTLAAALGDNAETGEDIAEAFRVLSRAEGLVRQLGDRRGQNIAARTRSRIQAAAKRKGIPLPKQGQGKSDQA